MGTKLSELKVNHSVENTILILKLFGVNLCNHNSESIFNELQCGYPLLRLGGPKVYRSFYINIK